MSALNTRDRSTNDAGFTLIELTLAVIILGIITGALIGVVAEYLKISASTRTRLSESTDQQFVSTYWQQDVSSLGRRTFTPATPSDPVPVASSVFVGGGSPGNCGAAAGTVVVAFAWTEFAVAAANPDDAWTSTAQEVAYVRSGTQLLRVRCRNGVADPARRVAHSIDGAPVVTCAPSCAPAGSLPRTVSMRFSVRDTSESTADTHYVTTVTADRRQG